MFSDPKKNISEMFIAEGMTVSDFGAGVGFYALALAEKVGEYGKVFALDVITDHLSKIQHEAERRGLKNLEVIHSDLELPNGSGLLGGSIDRVIITNVLFQTDHPERVIAEARRVIKRTGKVGVIEWIESFDMIGPHPDHVMSESETLTAFTKEGFILEKKFDSGSHHYGLLFKLAI